MVVLGADLHKRSHTVVAVDGTGRKLDVKTVAATTEGHLELRRWAEQWPERRWALEDCRQLSRRLEADLVRSGETVVRVPPKLMAGARRSVREPGKSDPIDAVAVARAALREPDLPIARLDGPERALRLLVDHREDLVAERTRHINRVRWLLVELDIAEPPARSLNRPAVIAQLSTELAGRSEPAARFARDLGGPLTAAKIVGEVAGITRFRSSAAFARHNGTAPVPVWSANRERHRLSRGGNRQLNAALHRIAITQLRLGGAGAAYRAKRLAMQNTATEAVRALRRRVSDEVFRRLRSDEGGRMAPPGALARAA